MHQNISLLPVPYANENNSLNSPDDTESEGNDNCNFSSTGNETEVKNIVHTYKKSVGLLFLSILLCLLSVFALFICLFTGAEKFISAEKIVGYIASDFLGIDPSKDNRNLYEILMSGSFGDSSQSTDNSKTENNEQYQENDTSPPLNDSTEDAYPPPDDNQPSLPDGNGSSSTIPEGEFAIVSTDLSSKKTSVSNQTEYKINIEDFINSSNKNEGYIFGINENMTVDPIVLIIHTHGTEAFSNEGSVSYSETTNVPRSDDVKQNIVAVGEEMARVFNENGIPTLHCRIMHDKESYKNSYMRAAETIKSYIEKYPSIQYVFDIHRDSIVNENNVKYKPITIINGDATAQVMLVMGSDYNSPSHINWKTNLTLALKLTESLNQKYTSFTRTVSLRSTSYNQEYTKGSLLLEIGSCGNTLKEAKRAGIIVANELSEIIKQGW